MGICRNCGLDAGWLSHECSSCRTKREAAEAAREAAESEAAELERRNRIDAMVAEAMEQLRADVAARGAIYLYDQVVSDLEDDGTVCEEGMAALRDYGERGWQVMTSRPILSVQHWADHVSDMSFGRAEFLLGLPVTAANLDGLDDELLTYYGDRAADQIAAEAPAE